MTIWESSAQDYSSAYFSVPFRATYSEDKSKYDHWWTSIQAVAEFRHLKWSHV